MKLSFFFLRAHYAHIYFIRLVQLADDGYPILQDILPAVYRKKIVFLYSKSLINQACEVKMAGYWPRYFLSFFFFRIMDRDGVKVHKQAKNELGQ